MLLLGLQFFAAIGCAPAVRMLAETQQYGDRKRGITFYVGGAGPIGNVGSLDVPGGMADAGYEGAVEIFTWQGFTHAGDQMNLSRNRLKAAELAEEIRKYRRLYPREKVNIIALSAGTGIATFAIEHLPEGAWIDRAVFLGCSMSSKYDMTRALRRVNDAIYVIYSRSDPVLNNLVRYTGTVDRGSGEEGIAGLRGFLPPDRLGPDTEVQYLKLVNVKHRYDFADAGYEGGHVDCTNRSFISRYIAKALMGDDKPLVGPEKEHADRWPWQMSAASEPASKPAISHDR